MLLFLLLACKEGVPTEAIPAGGYAPVEGSRFELVPVGSPEAAPWELRVEEGSWKMRIGDRWADASPIGAWPYEADPGLIVGESRLLPDKVEAGAQEEGAKVEGVDRGEVWYGTFDEVATVTIEAGDWAGEQRFARGVGPIFLTLGGESRELVYYE